MSLFTPGLSERLAAHWDREPRVFPGALRAPLFTTRDFMTAVLGTAAEYLSDPGTRVPPGRVFLGGAIVRPEQVGPFLPRDGAEAFEQYVGRIRQAHPREEVGIVLDACEKHLPGLRELLAPVLHGLFTRVGYPALPNHSCIYAGTYKTTPFGIHRDDCHVFMFSGVGRKRMAFWPRAYFEGRPELFAGGKLRAPVAEHLAQAAILEIGPHDVLYWPDDYWHVALSDSDEFRVALSVGIYHRGSSAEKLCSLDFLSTLAASRSLDLPGLPGAPNGRLSAEGLAATQMAAFFGRWNRLRDVLSTPGEAEYRALQIALRSISSAGFGKLPAARRGADGVLDTQSLRCALPESLVVAPVRGGLMLGANGSVFFYQRHSAAIESAVQQLRRGVPVRFEELAGAPDALSRPAVAAVVNDVVQAGAVSLALDTAPAA